MQIKDVLHVTVHTGLCRICPRGIHCKVRLEYHSGTKKELDTAAFSDIIKKMHWLHIIS
jgi:hypothetical protein